MIGEIDRVLNGNAVASCGRRTEHGEWDWLDAVDRRTVRRLTGAGYFARGGLSIDEMADMVAARVGGVETLDEAVEWFISTAVHELDARQAARRGEARWEDQERPDWLAA